jgi:chromosome segregation ATPase
MANSALSFSQKVGIVAEIYRTADPDALKNHPSVKKVVTTVQAFFNVLLGRANADLATYAQLRELKGRAQPVGHPAQEQVKQVAQAVQALVHPGSALNDPVDRLRAARQARNEAEQLAVLLSEEQKKNRAELMADLRTTLNNLNSTPEELREAIALAKTLSGEGLIESAEISELICNVAPQLILYHYAMSFTDFDKFSGLVDAHKQAAIDYMKNGSIDFEKLYKRTGRDRTKFAEEVAAFNRAGIIDKEQALSLQARFERRQANIEKVLQGIKNKKEAEKLAQIIPGLQNTVRTQEQQQAELSKQVQRLTSEVNELARQIETLKHEASRVAATPLVPEPGFVPDVDKMIEAEEGHHRRLTAALLKIKEEVSRYQPDLVTKKKALDQSTATLEAVAKDLQANRDELTKALQSYQRLAGKEYIVPTVPPAAAPDPAASVSVVPDDAARGPSVEAVLD